MRKGIHDQRYKWLIDQLAIERHRAGLSQEQVARRLGKRQQFVSKYESGERRLDIMEFLDVAQAIGADATALLHQVRQIASNDISGD